MAFVFDAKCQRSKCWHTQKAKLKLGIRTEDICKWQKGHDSMWTVTGIDARVSFVCSRSNYLTGER